MSFSIRFTRERVTDVARGEKAKFGEIVIGSYCERFFASLDYWRAFDYRNHWKTAITRIVEGKSRSSLITSMDDPAIAKRIFWRPMYRIGDMVYIQHQILFLDMLPTRFDEENPFKFVKERETVNENGEKISEWFVSVREMEVFLRRDGGESGRRRRTRGQ